MNRRDTAGIILLLMVAAGSWAMGEWWLFWGAVGAQAAVTLLLTHLNGYRTSKVTSK